MSDNRRSKWTEGGKDFGKIRGLALVAAAVWAASAVASEPDAGHVLSKSGSAKLAAYRANGEPVVILTVTARRGAVGQVAAQVHRLGGRIDFRHDGIDYLTAVLPAQQVAPFLATASIEAVDVDNLGEDGADVAGHFSVWKKAFPEAAVGDGRGDPPSAEVGTSWPPRSGAYKMEHPYDILRDLDGVDFRARHPGNDGRGVVIAHVEWFPDFLLPELQHAHDAEGRTVPKFADVVNLPATSRSLDANAPREGDMWSSRLTRPIRSQGKWLVYGGASYRVPGPDTYQLASFEIASGEVWATHLYPMLAKSYPSLIVQPDRAAPDDHHANRRGRPGEVIRYTVLWSDATRTAWLDTDGDDDFTDEQGIQDFRVAAQFGILGVDDPATPQRETVGYSVQKDGDYIAFNMGFGGHASLVAGAAAANRGSGGRVDGVAPGAQLIPIHCCARNTHSSYARALVAAFTHPRADVVLIEGHAQITGSQHDPKDGRSALALVLARLVEVYRKPTFMTAGNAPGMTTIMDTSIPANVMSVGAYHSAASVYANHGIRIRHADDLHWVGSEGPSGVGTLKPDLLSPANPMSLNPQFRSGDRISSRTDGVFDLPPGYAIGGGTSTATPVAAGVAAVLVGAAKREGLAHDATIIHRALRNSARFMPRLPAYKQGRGVIQLDGAWRYLQVAGPPEAVETIKVLAPLRTVHSDHFAGRDTGGGLFEREGWRAGDRASRTITLIRRGGPPGPQAYTLAWEGEQGAFTSASSITLPLGVPVKLNIDIAPPGVGAHSAILHLGRDGVPGTVLSIPATVVVPYDFTPEAQYAWESKFDLDRPGRHNLFFRVPENTQALTVLAKSPRDGITMYVYTPDNRIARGVVVSKVAGTGEVSLDRPMAGVWQVVIADQVDRIEVDWDVPQLQALPETPVTVSAGAKRVDLDVQGDIVRFHNRMAAYDGVTAHTALGGVRTRKSRMNPGQTVAFDIEVEEGTTFLVVQAEPLEVSMLDVDLYLFDCTGSERCLMSRAGRSSGTAEQVIVEHPAAGKWKALLVAEGQSGTVVTYSDYYTHPELGLLGTTDTLRTRELDATWEARLNVWHAGSPRPGYRPVGMIRVQEQGRRVTRGLPYGATSSYPLPVGLEWIPLER